MKTRGFAGLLVAIAFGLALFQARALANSLDQAAAETEFSALKIIKLHSIEGDFRTSLELVLAKAGGNEKSFDDRLRVKAEKLGEWEKIFEEKYRTQGAQADVWIGGPSDGEKTVLLNQMLDQKKSFKCAQCSDLSLETLKARLLPEAQLAAGSFGLSVFLEEGIASIIVAGE